MSRAKQIAEELCAFDTNMITRRTKEMIAEDAIQTFAREMADKLGKEIQLCYADPEGEAAQFGFRKAARLILEAAGLGEKA